MKFLEFIAFRILVAIFWLLPFWVIYLLSDLLFFVLYYVVKYRRAVAYDNLRKCFPDKSDQEINKMNKEFFHHLIDITFESVKGMSISKRQIQKRYVLKNTEVINSYYDENKSVMCLTSHYGNWEYGILGTDLGIKHQAVALYLPLSNKFSERYGLKRRRRFGMQMVEVSKTREIFANIPPKPVAIIMAADQSPANVEKAFKIKFLNRPTACLYGPEAYAKKVGLPILYLKISKLKRGYYSLEFERLIELPKDLEAGEVTKIYFNRLEKDILEKPEYWLWSHRRWKHNLDNYKIE